MYMYLYILHAGVGYVYTCKRVLGYMYLYILHAGVGYVYTCKRVLGTHVCRGQKHIDCPCGT